MGRDRWSRMARSTDCISRGGRVGSEEAFLKRSEVQLKGLAEEKVISGVQKETEGS